MPMARSSLAASDIPDRRGRSEPPRLPGSRPGTCHGRRARPPTSRCPPRPCALTASRRCRCRRADPSWCRGRASDPPATVPHNCRRRSGQSMKVGVQCRMECIKSTFPVRLMLTVFHQAKQRFQPRASCQIASHRRNWSKQILIRIQKSEENWSYCTFCHLDLVRSENRLCLCRLLS